MPSPDLSIHHVCGRDELGVAPLARADRIVSILDAGAPLPPELRAIDKPLLALRFDDVTRAMPGFAPPGAEHVRDLLAFDHAARPDERLVVHCTAGVSRSTAALAVLLAARHPMLTDELFEAIHAVRPQAWPNARIIELGDALLGRDGALVRALERYYAAHRHELP